MGRARQEPQKGTERGLTAAFSMAASHSCGGNRGPEAFATLVGRAEP